MEKIRHTEAEEAAPRGGKRFRYSGGRMPTNVPMPRETDHATVGEGRLRLAKEVRYLLLAAQREGQRQLAKALRPLGVTPAQAEAITVLDQFAPLTLAELGRYIV